MADFWRVVQAGVESGGISNPEVVEKLSKASNAFCTCMEGDCDPNALLSAFYGYFGKNNFCALALYKKFPVLRDKVPYPIAYGLSYERGHFPILEIEGLVQKKQEFLTRQVPIPQPGEVSLIPEILHLVWITTSARTLQENEDMFRKNNDYLLHNVRLTNGWTRILWTNDVDYIPSSFIAELNRDNVPVQIKSIDEICEDKTLDPRYKELVKHAKFLAEDGKFALATDILRDAVVYWMGGVYVDGDYEFRNVDRLKEFMKTYRSLFATTPSGKTDEYFINAFLASEKKGKVITKKLDLDYRNTLELHLDSTPEYVKRSSDEMSLPICNTGPAAMGVAFLDSYEDGIGKDAALGDCQLMVDGYEEFCPKDVITIGTDHWRGSWYSYERFDYYE